MINHQFHVVRSVIAAFDPVKVAERVQTPSVNPGFGELESERVGKVWGPHFPTLHSLILSSSHGTHAETVEALVCNPGLIR